MTAGESAAADGKPGPLVFLVAAEPSGDQLGGCLMAALEAETGGRVRFAGVGGEAMAARGLDSLVPMTELSVMGLVEVLPHLPRLLARLRRTADAAMAARPAAVVTIDSLSFNRRLARSLRRRGLGCPLVHYAAPKVWAWRPGRARRLAGLYDRLLTLLPFEPPLFERHGLATTFVGHPAVEAAGAGGDGAAFRARHGIPAAAPVVCVLPGSRAAEVGRLLPVFGATLARLAAGRPDLHAAVPSVAALAGEVRAAACGWTVPATVVTGPEEKAGAFAAARAALAASGTVAVELAVASLPCVVAYRVSPLTAALVRRLIRVEHVSLVNLVLGRAVQPERLQERCTPAELAAVLAPLIDDGAVRAAQVEGCREAVRLLGGGGEAPSRRAARAVLAAIAEGPGGRGPACYDRTDAKEARMSEATTGEAVPGAADDTQGYRLLHTMIRVKDLERSIDFYTRLLGMKLLRRKDYPSGEFTLAFVGYGDEAETAVIELTHNWYQETPYDLGEGFGHLAIGVPDIYAACKHLEAEGVSIPRPPGPMKHGGSEIAFIEDPDGYKIELVQRS